MKTIRVKPNDVITSMIVEETFVFCYELGKGFIKRNIERLNLEVYTFENIVAEIEAMTFTELTSTGFDSILFVNGSINESKKITETVQTELNLIPIGTHASFVDELIDTKKAKSRYFDITRAAPIKVILGNANFISDTNIQIVENISVGTAVSSDLILIKQDNYNYTLENYTDTFEFVNGILKTKGNIDYETRINYVLQIKISDKVDPTKFWNDIVNVEVINVPDTISINQSRLLTIDENSAQGMVIGSLANLFTKESGLNVALSLVNNTDIFGISGNNLIVNGLLDYETVTQHIVTVKITNVENINMFWYMDVTVGVNDILDYVYFTTTADKFGDNSAVAFYPMNGTVNDSTGVYDATQVNLTYTRLNEIVSAKFNGLNTKVEATKAITMNTKSASVSMFIKYDGGTMYQVHTAGQTVVNSGTLFSLVNAPANGTGLYGPGSRRVSLSFNKANYNLYFYIQNVDATSSGIGISTPNNSIVLNTWHHVVVTMDAQFTKIYIDGVEKVSNSSYTASFTYPLNIGGLNYFFYSSTYPYNKIYNYFSGNIDDVCVFNRGLTQSEVNSLYTTGASTIPEFIATKTDCFSDGSGKVFYNFNGHTNDESGLKNGTNTAGTFIGNNGENKSINLQGSSAAVTIPSYTLGTNFTISARCKMLSTGSATASILRANTTGWNTSGLEFLAGISNGKVNFNSSWCNGTARSSGGIAYNDICLVDTFYTVTLTRAGSVYNMYVDGVWVGTHSNSTTGQSLASPVIGNYNNGTNYGSNLVVDNFRLFNRALTQSEITTLFNNDNYTPIAVDKADFFNNNSAVALYKMDGNVNNESGINNGTPTSLTYGEAKVGQSALFNGSSSKVMTSTVFPTGGGSLSLWVYITKTTGDNIIIGQSGWIYFGLNVNAATATPMGITINNHSTIANGFSAGNNVLNLNTWHHITIVDTNTLTTGNIKCYVDGIEIPHTKAGWTNTGTLGGFAITNIGNYVPNTTHNFGGKMRQFRVFNKVLTQQQVTDLMNAESPFIK